MELRPSPQADGSGEANGDPAEGRAPQEDSEGGAGREAVVKSPECPSAELKPEKSASPPPPPRPRTPTDERDPELVHAERRYLSYFQGPPCKRRQARSPSLEPPEPTFQQLEAQRRYSSYFLGGPRASTPAGEEAGRSPEPDEARLAAQKRYRAYFEPGPPRPRSARSQEPSEPDPEQVEAERRYLKHFSSGPPRPPQAEEGRTPEPDAEQLEAERRYLAYFRPGPPRPRPRPSSMVESSPEPDAQQLEAERRYLNYFRTGPPRPRPSSVTEADREPDEQQLEAERRYLAYFQGTPKPKRKTDEEREKERDGKLRVPPTREMLEAEERFLSYFKPIPRGEPKHTVTEPPVSERDKVRQQLMKEYWEAMETRVDRREKKIVKVSRPKREVKRETTPPTQRELVVEEFLQKVKDRKKEKDLHYGDTDDDEEEEGAGAKTNPKEDAQNPAAGDLPTPTIEGGGEVKGRIVEDLGLFVSEEGVWSPGKPGDQRGASGPSRIDLPDLPSFKDQPSVWSPGRAGSASPSLGRKEYRKITYEGTPTLQKRPSQENVTAPSPEESFAWKDAFADKVARSPTSALPKVQNPTVTLLQKKREGQIPGKRPEYLKPDDIGPKYKPDDKLYVIKREYESEDEEGGRRFAVLGPKKVTGVGPTTSDGVPTTLKSGVKSEHQGEWYRRMFDSLHKVKDDDHIIIKYKVPRARYGGYMSEPEGYDSDVCSSRYSTLDRRRQHHYEMDPMTTSLPRNTNRYVHQPGRIEDYIPGYSSLSEKELKKNPEADIKLESQTQEPPPVSVNHRLASQKMSITHALKESGYESDSTLVFRKREDARRQVPDPRKTSQVYRQIQRGGDIPLTGLQKPNPPKPRESPYKYESGEVNIHYRTPVRLEQKEAIPEEELARRQEEHMKKVYENERRKKYLAELEDIERRRHTDNFTPLQKSPIPLNRYDDDSSLGTMRGARTPELKQVAKAMYNFTAQNKRELTFSKGDVVFIRRQIDKNWYEGESRGSVGIFPCNYVEIVPYESIKTLTRKPTEGQARARFNFQAQTSMEMSLSKGELVVLSRRVDENWYEGRIGNRKGIFPVSYVDTLVEPGSDRPMTPSSSPMPRPALPAANLLYNGASSYSSPYSTLGRPESQNDSRPYTQSLTVNTQQEPVAYRALYNYKPQNDDELELLESDIVMVMEKCDDGWFVGTSRRTGLFGTFPGNYVERV